MPLLKQVNMEPIFKNYCPVSNLKYISKLIERVVALQLNEHLMKMIYLSQCNPHIKQGTVLRPIKSRKLYFDGYRQTKINCAVAIGFVCCF